jgi:hypothetical protein
MKIVMTWYQSVGYFFLLFMGLCSEYWDCSKCINSSSLICPRFVCCHHTRPLSLNNRKKTYKHSKTNWLEMVRLRFIYIRRRGLFCQSLLTADWRIFHIRTLIGHLLLISRWLYSLVFSLIIQLSISLITAFWEAMKSSDMCTVDMGVLF